MDDLFLLDKKIGRKNEKLGKLKKFKKLLICKVEHAEEKKADELVEGRES